jgi:hypothetical protein
MSGSTLDQTHASRQGSSRQCARVADARQHGASLKRYRVRPLQYFEASTTEPLTCCLARQDLRQAASDTPTVGPCIDLEREAAAMLARE